MSAALWQAIKTELLPFEGRLAMAWRVAAICSLTAMMFMIYQIPLVAIGCYLVLFLIRPNTAESMLMALGICVLVSVAVLMLVMLTRLAVESPLWIMIIIAVGSFVFLYLGVASKLGPAGSIVALVVAFIMTLVGYVPFGEIATRAILYAWLMTLVPMGVLLAFLAVVGPSPRRLTRQRLAERLQLIAATLRRQGTTEALETALREGNDFLTKTIVFVKLFSLSSRAELQRLQALQHNSYQLLLACKALLRSPQQWDEESAQWLAQRCEAWADAVLRADVVSEESIPTLRLPSRAWQRVEGLVLHIVELTPSREKIPTSGFFLPDARTNPTYQYYALKTTAAAIICYLVYTALQWQDIHTAMITCYVVALGTTGETVHKLTLRIVGCLIGAALGVGSLLLLMPYMTSIGQLMLLVFAGTLCAAWVSVGSERISYAGVQIGLAFLLTVLQGFGPDVELSVAMDRILGVLLGNAVMYVMFTRVWPWSTNKAVTQRLQQLLGWWREKASEQPAWQASQWQDVGEYIMGEIATVREQLVMRHFEPAALRPATQQQQLLLTMPDALETLYLQAAFPPHEVSEQQAADLVHALEQLDQQLLDSATDTLGSLAMAKGQE
ncbi:FUSC family protein [Paenalcaligenes sp. Me131]|uniref:FUSC family protein n=1 Tax=Paenalcaligenes sp. Me131 TaxID=3392636 RepID=UPI003D2DB380